MAYLGKSPSQGVRNRYYFTASGGETSISGALTGGTLTFTDGNYVDVNLNGVTLVAGTDYNTSTANTIAGLSALTASDVVEIVVYDVFSVFSGNVNSDFSVGGNLSVTGTTAFTGATTITGLTTTGDINFGDNDKAIFGAGSDLQIYHDGSNSYISEGGTGNLFLGATNLFLRSSTGETYIGAVQDGAVTLYHDNAAKLATTATGVDVTGVITTDGMTTSGNIELAKDAPQIDFNDTAGGTQVDYRLKVDAGEFSITDVTNSYEQVEIAGGIVKLRHNGSTKVSTTSTGVDVTGTVTADGLTVDQGSGGQGISLQRSSYDTMDIELSENGFRIRNETDGRTDLFIDGSGNVGIGTSSPSQEMHLYAGSGATDFLIEQGSTGNAYLHTKNSNREYLIGTGGDALKFYDLTADAERMRIDASGHVGIGTTTLTGTGVPDETNDGTGTRILSIGFLGIGRDNGICGQFNRNNDGAILGFRRGGTEVGTISVGSSSTAYNTSSDYRLKENVVADWDATTRLKQLNPVRFNFIADADTTVDGFLAHEVQSIVPEAITGTKDEVDADGNPVMQGIDQSKIVPLLVKTIQELEARIAALEA